MTAEELKQKYPPPILWTEYRTSVQSVESLWMTGSTTKDPNAPIKSHFHIIFKDGERKDFRNYDNPDVLLSDVTKYLEELKKQEEA